VTAQLLDASSGYHLWAERYDREAADIFDVQDDIARQIVAALAVQLTEAEKDLIERRETDSPEAHDCVLRGHDLLNRTTREGNARAREQFQEALAIDPGYPAAWSGLGMAHQLDFTLGFTSDLAAVERAAEYADRALALDPELIQALALRGLTQFHQGDVEAGIAQLQRAVALGPNSADAWYILASLTNAAGRPEEALGHVDRAIRLNPNYTFAFPFELGHSQYLLGELEKAVASLHRALRLNPDFHVADIFLALCYSELGLDDEAGRHLERALGAWDDLTMDEARSRFRYGDPAVTDRVLEGLRRAGLPE
jgi:adenylate cyclase